jgi:hypothetical protein
MRRVAIPARRESASPRAGLFIVVGPQNGIMLLSMDEESLPVNQPEGQSPHPVFIDINQSARI